MPDAPLSLVKWPAVHARHSEKLNPFHLDAAPTRLENVHTAWVAPIYVHAARLHLK